MNIPFFLSPSGKDYLWGGNRLKDEYDKRIDMTPLAETWECSTHSDGPSYVASGEYKGMSLKDVLEMNPSYLGTRNEKKYDFPILIKLIDAKEDLSIQVHPNDEFAAKYENNSRGKTEMWYVLDADEDSRLVFGLKEGCSKETIKSAIERNEIERLVQKVPIKKNDMFFIESGIIHALGKGALVAEIQENSNLTYRLYDYNRVDCNGNKRALHIDKALEVARLNESSEPRQPMRVLKYRPGIAQELLCNSKYFSVYRLLMKTEENRWIAVDNDELGFKVLLCIEGKGTLRFDNNAKTETYDFKKGDCLFVPADSNTIYLAGEAAFLDVRA